MQENEITDFDSRWSVEKWLVIDLTSIDKMKYQVEEHNKLRFQVQSRISDKILLKIERVFDRILVAELCMQLDFELGLLHMAQVFHAKECVAGISLISRTFTKPNNLARK